MKIRSISWGEEPFHLGAPGAAHLSKFFKIDSIDLVIGKNGSGKTRMLEQIAKVLGTTSGSFNEVSAEVDGEWRQLSTAERKDIGVVYFTPLPYRRRFARTRKFIDASPNYRDEFSAPDYEVFQKVAKDLGVKTLLRGTMKYNRVDVENSLISAVMSGQLTFTVPEIEASSQKLRSTLRVTRLNYLDDVESYFEVDHFIPKNITIHSLDYKNLIFSNHEEQKADVLTNIKSFERRNFFALFYKALTDKLGSEVSAVVLLSVFYMKVAKSKAPRHLMFCLLEDFGLAALTHDVSPKIKQEYKKITNTALHAMSVLNTMSDVKVAENTVSFKIGTAEQLEMARLRDSLFAVEWSDLSSGMRALIDQFCGLRKAIERAYKGGAKSVVLLVDEGDAYLHLDWQRKYVFLLDNFLAALKAGLRLKSVHVILATHSPVIASDFPGEMVHRLDADIERLYKTFAAPIETIIFQSFESSSIGEVAVRKVRKLHKTLSKNVPTEKDLSLLHEIGDITLKNALLRSTIAVKNNDN
jgi:predicted ATP-binding protein involved in virulence